MCLLIHQPKGHTLSTRTLESAARKNADGFGVMYAESGRVHTFRMIGTAAEMIAAYRKHAAGRECFVHFRMTTHGETNVENAHPFRISDACAVMHNGIIDIETPRREMSDTWHFSEYVVRPALIAGLVRDASWLAVARGIIGRGSKVAILHGDGTHVILNRESGLEAGGVWYSNTYAWDVPAELLPKYVPNTYVGRYSGYGRVLRDFDDEFGRVDYTRSNVVERVPVTVSAPLASVETELTDDEATEAYDTICGVTAHAATEAEAEAVLSAWLESADTEQLAAASVALVDWFNFSGREAHDLVRERAGDAASYLASLVMA
jgi:hypothetical protein